LNAGVKIWRLQTKLTTAIDNNRKIFERDPQARKKLSLLMLHDVECHSLKGPSRIVTMVKYKKLL
jgi:hypothetical protein